MSFLHPVILFAALGVSLPILAHLLNSHKVKRTDWAAMQFLNRNVRVRSRQLRLKDYVLLALRCLALLLLVAALSRPASSQGDGSWLPGERRAGVIIALDASYSMNHTDEGRSRFQRALEQVEAIRDQIHTCLLYTSPSPRDS